MAPGPSVANVCYIIHGFHLWSFSCHVEDHTADSSELILLHSINIAYVVVHTMGTHSHLTEARAAGRAADTVLFFIFPPGYCDRSWEAVPVASPTQGCLFAAVGNKIRSEFS